MAYSNFTWADAWIVISIIYKSPNNDGATVCGIIEVGDAINHAIFTRGELEMGLSRLIEAGFVVRLQDKFKVSQAVVEIYQKIAAKKLPPLEQMHELQIFLKTKPWDSDYRPPITDLEQVVSVDTFEKAVKDYRHNFWKNSHK